MQAAQGMDKETTPTPAMALSAKYRGAVVEVKSECLLATDLQDLQLPPAFCLPEDAPLHHALEAAYEKEFDHLPCVPTDI
jgi:hypothetical protein